MPRKSSTKPAASKSKKVAAKTASSKSKTTAKENVTVAPPTPAPTTTTAPTSATEPVSSPLSAELTAEFANWHAQLQQLQAGISALRNGARALEKRATRELKVAHKAQQKRKRRAGNRSPSGFVKPTLISNELAAFLGKDQGTEMARTEVTREINAYIRANNLQDKDNGRKINADSKLTKLLKLSKSDELTYFNLQKFMSPHFAKASTTSAASSQ